MASLGRFVAFRYRHLCNPLQFITFHSVTKVVELIVIKMHLSGEFGSNASRPNTSRRRWIGRRSKFGYLVGCTCAWALAQRNFRPLVTRFYKWVSQACRKHVSRLLLCKVAGASSCLSVLGVDVFRSPLAEIDHSYNVNGWTISWAAQCRDYFRDSRIGDTINQTLHPRLSYCTNGET